MRGLTASAQAEMDKVLKGFLYLIGYVVRVLLPLYEPYGVFNKRRVGIGLSEDFFQHLLHLWPFRAYHLGYYLSHTPLTLFGMHYG